MRLCFDSTFLPLLLRPERSGSPDGLPTDDEGRNTFTDSVKQYAMIITMMITMMEPFRRNSDATVAFLRCLAVGDKCYVTCSVLGELQMKVARNAERILIYAPLMQWTFRAYFE